MNEIQKQQDSTIISKIVLQGDISGLSPQERMQYYNRFCHSLGLNPVTQPFQIIRFKGGKEQLYATKDCTDQLRKLNGVSITDLERSFDHDICIVTVKGTDKTGRTDCATGAVTMGKATGDALCNIIMKAETKAKRRLTLSLCGLGILDESEVETVPGAEINVTNEPIPQKNINKQVDKKQIEEAENNILTLLQSDLMPEDEKKKVFSAMNDQKAKLNTADYCTWLTGLVSRTEKHIEDLEQSAQDQLEIPFEDVPNEK